MVRRGADDRDQIGFANSGSEDERVGAAVQRFTQTGFYIEIGSNQKKKSRVIRGNRNSIQRGVVNCSSVDLSR